MSSDLLAERLKTARKQRGWSQRELAQRCGLGDSQVNKYEAGVHDPSATYLKLMAQQLGVSTDYLLGLTDDPQARLINAELSDDERLLVDVYRQGGWKGIIHLGADKVAK